MSGTVFADLFLSQWPMLTALHGETATYTDASENPTSVTAVIVPRQDAVTMDDTWETRARQADIYIDVDSVASITFTPRKDTITSAGSDVYTILERDVGNGAVYRYACERQDIQKISLRGRRY